MKPAPGKRRRDQDRVHAGRRLAQRQGCRSLRQAFQARAHLARIGEQRHQDRRMLHQLQQLREGREHLSVHRHVAGTRADACNRVVPIRRELPHRLTAETGREGIPGTQGGVRLDIEEPLGIDLLEAGAEAGAVLAAHPRQIVGRKHRGPAVRPSDGRRAAARVDRTHAPPPVALAAGQVHQDAVEAVAPLQADQRLGKRFRRVPDLERVDAALQEVVPERQLTHDRHPVGLAQPHGNGHPFAARHET